MHKKRNKVNNTYSDNMKKITNIISYILIIILTLYILLRSVGIVRVYKVLTGSMELKIHPGDYIVVTNSKNYKVGDIVTYKQDKYYITHRIIEMNGNKVVTKGDANNVSDEEINIKDIVGKYLYKSVLIKYIINYKYIIIGFFIAIFMIKSFLIKKSE